MSRCRLLVALLLFVQVAAFAAWESVMEIDGKEPVEQEAK